MNADDSNVQKLGNDASEVPEEKRTTNSAKRACARQQHDQPREKNDDVLAEQQRTAIFVLFVQVFDAPPKEEWCGQDGTIAKIMKSLHMPDGSRDVVARVLTDAAKCIDDGVPYCASRKLPATEHSKALIQRGSPEEQIAADCIEDGHSFAQAASYVNEYRISHGLPHIGTSAVQTWCERMSHAGVSKTSRISKMKQGMLFLVLLKLL